MTPVLMENANFENPTEESTPKRKHSTSFSEPSFLSSEDENFLLQETETETEESFQEVVKF